MSPAHSGARRRVALVSLLDNPTWTSPERFIAGDVTRRGLSAALRARGWDVDVVVEAAFLDRRRVVPGIGLDRSDGVRWHFCPPDPFVLATRRLGRALGDADPRVRTPGAHLWRKLRSLQPDILHAFDLTFYPHLGLLGALGPPLVAHFHGGSAARRAGWRLAERLALAQVDRLLFSTREQAEGWIANGYPAERVRTVLETSVEPRPPEVARPERRAASGAPLLLCVGRLDAVKDPLTTLAGFTALLATHPAAILHLCWTEAPLHQEVLARARALGSRVQLLGRVGHDAVVARIAAADVLVQSSTREVCGVAVLEAMAAGTPPVVTDIPAFRAVLGETGARFAVGDAGGLANGVRRVLADPTQRERCRQRFDQSLSFDALAIEVERVYRELVA